MDGVLDEHGNRVPFWGDDDDPALHALRAGGEQAHDFVHGFSSEVLGSSTRSPTTLKSISTLSALLSFPVLLRPCHARGRRWKQFMMKSCRNIGH